MANRQSSSASALLGASGFFLLLFVAVIAGIVIYSMFQLDVPTAHMAVLIKKTGKDLPNDDEIAPSTEYKGVQRQVLTEGRYLYNPWNWEWEIVPQVEIPEGKLGVRIRLYGD